MYNPREAVLAALTNQQSAPAPVQNTSAPSFFNDFVSRGGATPAAIPSVANAPFSQNDMSRNIGAVSNNQPQKTAEDEAIENAKRMESSGKLAVQGEERAALERQRADYQKQLDDLNKGIGINVLLPKNEAEIQENMKRGELQAHIDDIDRQLAKEYSRGEATLNAWATGTKGAYEVAASTLQDFAKRNEGRVNRDIELIGIDNKPREGENWDALKTENKPLEQSFDWLSNYKDAGMANIAKANQQKAEAKEGASGATKFALDAFSTGLDIAADTALALATFGGAGSVSMAARVFGNTAAESAAKGESLDRQVAKGLTAAAIETFTEKIGGGFEKAYGATLGKRFGSKMSEVATKVVNAKGEAIKAFLKSSGSEALEEGLSDVLNIVADYVFGWEKGDGTTAQNIWNEIMDSKSDILYDMILGGFVGMFGAVGESANAYNDANARNAAIREGVYNAVKDKFNTQAQEQAKSKAPTAAENFEEANRTNDWRRIRADQMAQERAAQASDTKVPQAAPIPSAQAQPAENHIDNRNFSDVANRNQNAFQYEHPELHNYFANAAEQLINEVDNALGEDRLKAGQKGSRTYSAPIKRLVDYGMTKPRIMQCLMDIIENHGAENYADAKRVEIVLDDMLSNGWRSANKTAYNPNTDYVNAKGGIAGAKDVNSWESFLDEHYLSILDGLTTEEELRSEWEAQQAQMQPTPTSANKAPTGADILTEVISPKNAQQTAQVGANPLKVDTQQNGQTAQPVEYTKPGDNGAERVRGMDENVMSDAAMEQAIRDEVASDPDYYKQRTNADTLDAAKEIYSHGLEAAQATLNEALGKAKAGSKLAPEMVPLARMVANQLTRDGNVTEARRIISDIGAELTAAGQLGQAARILRDADPVTRVDVIKKMIAHLNSDLSKGQKRTNVRRGNGDTSGNILVNEDLLNQYANATDPEVQNQIIDNITTEIANQIPATLKEKFTAIRYLNMLGNFKTQGRNIVGNSVMAAFTVAKRHIVQSAAEMAASLATGGKTERNTSLVYDPALYKEAKADFANVSDEAMGESKYTDVSRIANNEIQNKREVFDWNIPLLSKAMQGYRTATNFAMDEGDRIFLRLHYADSMAGWMQAHGIKSMSEMTADQLADARAFSIKEAQEATFRDQNAISDFAKNFDKNWGKAKVVTQGIMPFRGTPANVGVRAIEYSPVGVIETIYKGIQASQGKTDVADVINSLSKNATGSALAIAGYLMAAAGTARGGEDDDKLDAFQKLQGQSDYSVNVNGNWVSLSQLAPMSVPFFMGVKLEEMLSDTEQFTTDDIMKILGCVTDPMLDMSMLSGVNDALDNIANFNGNVDALPKFLTNAVIGYLTQGLTNSLAGQLEQASEENRQTIYSTNDGIIGKNMQYTLGKSLAKTPGIDYNQQDYVDAWGRTQSNGDLKERVWNSLFNPTYATKENSTEVDKELERLYSDNKNVDGFPDVLPQKGSRSLTYKDADGIEHGLTPDEYMQYSKDRGQMSLKLVSDFMDSSQYKSMSDLERADVINKLYSFAADRALHTVKEANGVKDSSDYQMLISGVDKPGYDDDRTPIKEENVPTYIVYKAQLSSARKGDTPDYKAQDALLGQYDKLPKDVQAGLLEHGIVTKQDMDEHRVGLSTETIAKFELAKDKAQEKLDANSDKSGVVSLYGLANADLSEKDVQAILDNYSTLKSGYLSKATATTAKIMRSFGYTLNDAADFFYTADYKDGETSGSLNGSKLAVAISQLQGLTPKEQEAMYQEFRKELDYDGNPYPWKTSYNRAFNSASTSMRRYGSSYGRTGDDNKIANIKRGTPGADLLVSATNTAQPQQQPTDFFSMFQTNAVRR